MWSESRKDTYRVGLLKLLDFLKKCQVVGHQVVLTVEADGVHPRELSFKLIESWAIS